MLENVDVIGGQTDTGQNCLGGDACVSAHCSPCTSMVPSEASKDHQGISFAKDDATGGKCPVNWITVCSPRRFAGLGITNLDSHSVALRVRWLWQPWTDDSKPWFGVPVLVDDVVHQVFDASAVFQIGDGAHQLLARLLAV
jgi:hypothetical protein